MKKVYMLFSLTIKALSWKFLCQRTKQSQVTSIALKTEEILLEYLSDNRYIVSATFERQCACIQTLDCDQVKKQVNVLPHTSVSLKFSTVPLFSVHNLIFPIWIRINITNIQNALGPSTYQYMMNVPIDE